MSKIWISLVLIYVLVFTAAPVLAGSQDTQTVEQVKARVAQLGTGTKARATVRLKSGTKIKGYVEQSGDQEFTFRDKDTGSSVRVLYQDVAKIEERKGHSTAKWVTIGVAIGAGAFLTVLLIAFSQLND